MSNLDRVGVFSRVKYFREKAGLTVYQLSMKAGFYSENGNMASRSISRLEASEDARDKQQKESGFAENKNVVNDQAVSINLTAALRIFKVLQKTGVVSHFEEVFELRNFDEDRNVQAFHNLRK